MHLARPTVLLRHLLPDGSAHFDWMIATDPSGEGPLVTYRVGCRLDQVADGDVVVARRLEDHRPRYLDYEGRIDADRGSVERVARGRVAGPPSRPTVVWEGGATQRLSLVETAGGCRIVCETLGSDIDHSESTDCAVP